LQDIDNQFAYKYGKAVYLTFAGIERFTQETRNENAMKNKGAFLEALHTGYTALRATTSVNTSKPYVQSVQKKASLEGAALEDEALTLVQKQRDEMELLMPVIRVKNEEEVQHIHTVNLAKSEQLIIQQKFNAEQFKTLQETNAEELLQKDAWQERIRMGHEADLLQKDALQKRLRIEREESLQYEKRMQEMAHENEKRMQEMAHENEKRMQEMAHENEKRAHDTKHENEKKMLETERAKIHLEHERKMLLDLSYKAAFLESERLDHLPVATVVSIVPLESPPKRARKEKVEMSEAKKQANAARALKSAATRKVRMEARVEAYLAATVQDKSPAASRARYDDLRIRAGLPRNGAM
jgi:hypothetical protein